MSKKNHAPKEPEPGKQPGIFKKIYDWGYKKWDEEGRPGFLEIKLVYIPSAIGVAVLAGGLGINIYDEVFDKNIANDWANIKIEPQDNYWERSGESLLQCMGSLASSEPEGECRAVSVILKLDN